eukprot:XP_001693322.1 predicted protein [Chlamydomonas reinhardtii]
MVYIAPPRGDKRPARGARQAEENTRILQREREALGIQAEAKKEAYRRELEEQIRARQAAKDAEQRLTVEVPGPDDMPDAGPGMLIPRSPSPGPGPGGLAGRERGVSYAGGGGGGLLAEPSGGGGLGGPGGSPAQLPCPEEQVRMREDFARQAAAMEKLANDASRALADRDDAWRELQRGAGESMEQYAASTVVINTHLVPKSLNAIPDALPKPLAKMAASMGEEEEAEAGAARRPMRQRERSMPGHSEHVPTESGASMLVGGGPHLHPHLPDLAHSGSSQRGAAASPPATAAAAATAASPPHSPRAASAAHDEDDGYSDDFHHDAADHDHADHDHVDHDHNDDVQHHGLEKELHEERNEQPHGGEGGSRAGRLSDGGLGGVVPRLQHTDSVATHNSFTSQPSLGARVASPAAAQDDDAAAAAAEAAGVPVRRPVRPGKRTSQPNGSQSDVPQEAAAAIDGNEDEGAGEAGVSDVGEH